MYSRHIQSLREREVRERREIKGVTELRMTECDKERQETEIDRERQRETERDRERQRETERDRERQKEIERSFANKKGKFKSEREREIER